MKRNKFSRIIYLVASPWNYRDHKRHGADIFQKNGYEVIVLDFTYAIYPLFPMKPLYNDFYKHYQFFSEKEVLTSIESLNTSDLIIELCNFSPKHFFIYQALSKMKLTYAIAENNCYPQGIVSNNAPHPKLINRLSNFLKLPFNVMLKRIKHKFKWKYDCQKKYIRGPSYIIAGGKYSINFSLTFDFKFKSPKIIWTHALDYDIYLESKKNICKSDEFPKSFIVFLDQYFPFHTDYYIMTDSILINPETYYSKICSFFDYLENKFQIPVVIAAHPRAEYEKHPNYYKGRRVVKNKTNDLVKRSEFIVAHSSTAINFPVIYIKPVIFIKTNELEECYYIGPDIEAMSKCFNKIPINIDNIDFNMINFTTELTVDDKIYEQYKENYIKRSLSVNKLSWEIVIDAINEI